MAWIEAALGRCFALACILAAFMAGAALAGSGAARYGIAPTLPAMATEAAAPPDDDAFSARVRQSLASAHDTSAHDRQKDLARRVGFDRQTLRAGDLQAVAFAQGQAVHGDAALGDNEIRGLLGR